MPKSTLPPVEHPARPPGFAEALDDLLAPKPAAIAVLARDLLAVLFAIAPDLAPKVQTGWGSINFRHKRAGFICAVFPYPDRVSLIFEHGRQLSNDSELLQGDHRQIRFIPFVPGDTIPADDLAALIGEAIALRG